MFLDEDVQLSSRFVGQEVVFCCMVKNRGRKRKGKSSPPASLCFPIPGRAVELDFLVDHVRAQIQDEEAARRPLLRLCEEIVARIPVCHPIGSLVFFVDAVRNPAVPRQSLFHILCGVGVLVYCLTVALPTGCASPLATSKSPSGVQG